MGGTWERREAESKEMPILLDAQGAALALGVRRHITNLCRACGKDLIAASIYDEYSIGPSIRPICTRYCFTMTNMPISGTWERREAELEEVPEPPELLERPRVLLRDHFTQFNN